MSRPLKAFLVLSVLLLATAITASATATHPLYGTKGLFRTFSADTIAEDGKPSIGITLVSLHGFGTDLDYKYELYLNPHMGVTVAPIKYVEGAFHISGIGHVREPVVETQTIEGDLSDMNWAIKGHFADQDQAWASFATLVYMDFNIRDEADILDDPNTPGDEGISYVAQGQNNIGIMGLISKDFDFGGNSALAVNLNVGYLIRNGEFEMEAAHKGIRELIERPDALTYSAGLEVTPGTKLVSLIFEASGQMNSTYTSTDPSATPPLAVDMRDTNLELTGGARFNGSDFAHVGLGGSYRINDSWGPYSGPDYRYFLTGSLDIPLVAGDRDKDGIKDAKDKCPDDPEDYDGFEDYDGCPDLDNDKDGVPDDKDQCPNDPEDIDLFEDSDGCPDPDNDGDGILDADDKCPNEAENFNGIDDEDGCPDEEAEPEVTRFILEDLKFKPNSAELVEGTYGSLEKAGKTLKDSPEIKVLIEGHAASTGKPDFEKTLSQERADSVKTYLVNTYNIDPSRIRTVGYGSTKPIADNSTEEGRKMNRRIEFVVE